MKRSFRSFDGVRISYLYEKGILTLTLVFLHGVGGNWTMWKREIEHFKTKGYSTLALDLRGHGESGAPMDFRRYRLSHFSRDVHEVVKRENIRAFCLVGHSLGGAISINYCMRYPKSFPASLVLVESACTYPFDHDRLLNLSPYVTHFLRFIARHKLTRKEHFFHFKDIDLSVEGIKARLHFLTHLLHLTPLRSIVLALDNVERYVFRNQKRINEALMHLTIPTLLIAGGSDSIVPTRFSRFLKRACVEGLVSLTKKILEG